MPHIAQRLRSGVGNLLRETPVARAAWKARDWAEAADAYVRAGRARKARRGAAVIMYHGVTPALVDPMVENAHLDAGLFRQQLQHLKRHYTVVPLAELVDRLERALPVPDDWAVLTFDDGYRNNLHCAWELVRAEGLSMSVFVVTDILGTKTTLLPTLVLMAIAGCRADTIRVPRPGEQWAERRVDSRRRRVNTYYELSGVMKAMDAETRARIFEEFFAQLGDGELDEIRERFSSYDWLDWDEARQLHADGVDVGSHTRTHAYMRDELGRERLEAEIIGSRKRLEKELGTAPPHFCYPNGSRADFSDWSGEIVREAGYRCALTTVRGPVLPGDDRFELRRLGGVTVSMPRFRIGNATAQA